MQTLKLADHLFHTIDSGWKTATIRSGKRDILPGPLRFEATDGTVPSRDVTVRRVSYAFVRDLTDGDIFQDGASTRESLISGLKHFYPDLTNDSLVTIVAFDAG
jgi:hypothetical protein